MGNKYCTYKYGGKTRAVAQWKDGYSPHTKGGGGELPQYVGMILEILKNYDDRAMV
jgi:hypothetical protein